MILLSSTVSRMASCGIDSHRHFFTPSSQGFTDAAAAVKWRGPCVHSLTPRILGTLQQQQNPILAHLHFAPAILTRSAAEWKDLCIFQRYDAVRRAVKLLQRCHSIGFTNWCHLLCKFQYSLPLAGIIRKHNIPGGASCDGKANEPR